MVECEGEVACYGNYIKIYIKLYIIILKWQFPVLALSVAEMVHIQLSYGSVYPNQSPLCFPVTTWEQSEIFYLGLKDVNWMNCRSCFGMAF